jgi:hypothetical protein
LPKIKKIRLNVQLPYDLAVSLLGAENIEFYLSLLLLEIVKAKESFHCFVRVGHMLWTRLPVLPDKAKHRPSKFLFCAS